MLKREDVILFSGGAQGAEEPSSARAPSASASRKSTSRSTATSRRARAACACSITKSSHAGEVSLAYVSRLMNRRYPDTPTFRKILQSIWYQINNGQEIYVDRRDPARSDRARRHRLGRGVREVVQQAAVRLRSGEGRAGSQWDGEAAKWTARSGSDEPVIQHVHFTGTGTRMLTPGRADRPSRALLHAARF